MRSILKKIIHIIISVLAVCVVASMVIPAFIAACAIHILNKIFSIPLLKL